ncbi:hypothetical protein IPJ72_07375 [Candidatus Peregrinibacteria bacterium]|nr:MAG: hypothetical protein IPJ72_07375 [Candidatus Peregrinibacteria bacterium]
MEEIRGEKAAACREKLRASREPNEGPIVGTKERPTTFESFEECVAELAALHGVESEEAQAALLGTIIRIGRGNIDMNLVMKAVTSFKIKYLSNEENPIQQRDARQVELECTFPQTNYRLIIKTLSTKSRTTGQRTLTATSSTVRRALLAISALLNGLSSKSAKAQPQGQPL